MLIRKDDVEQLKKVDVDRVKSRSMSHIQQLYGNLTSTQSEYLAGLGSACLATTFTYPINKIIFRQSLWGLDFEKALRQLRIEGFGNLFRGCLPPIMTKSLNASVMFGAYNDFYLKLRDGWIGKKLLKDNGVAIKFCAGMASGTTEAILMPLERVQMLLQDGRLNNRYRNTFHVIYSLKQYGLREYYRGVTAVLLRNGPATFLYFGLQPSLKNFLSGYPAGDDKQFHRITEIRELYAQFVSGALLGATISTITFPLNVIRIHMQTQEVGSEMASVGRTLRRLWSDEYGRRKLVSGIYMNAFRSVLYWGCITVFSVSLRQYFNHELDR